MSILKASLDTENFILHINNFLDVNLCNYLIEQGENRIATNDKGVVFDNFDGRQDTQIFSIDKDNTEFNPIVPSLNVPFSYLLDEMIAFSTCLYTSVIHGALTSLPVPRGFKWQKTNIKTKGFSDWHTEQSLRQSGLRVLVWSIYLNDVEYGGETEFLYQGKRYKPKTGDFLMWPAGVTHLHRGNPPLSNTKYILTGWLYAATEDTEIEESERMYSSILNNEPSHFKYYTAPSMMELNK